MNLIENIKDYTLADIIIHVYMYKKIIADALSPDILANCNNLKHDSLTAVNNSHT